MKRTRSIFENYLATIDRLHPEQLGAETKKEVTQTDNDNLQDLLKHQLKFNNKITILAVLLFCILFSTAVFFVFYYRDNPAVMGIIFGAAFLSILLIAIWLRNLYREKNIMNISLNIIWSLSPKEAAKLIEIIYWNILYKTKYDNKE